MALLSSRILDRTRLFSEKDDCFLSIPCGFWRVCSSIFGSLTVSSLFLFVVSFDYLGLQGISEMFSLLTDVFSWLESLAGSVELPPLSAFSHCCWNWVLFSVQGAREPLLWSSVQLLDVDASLADDDCWLSEDFVFDSGSSDFGLDRFTAEVLITMDLLALTSLFCSFSRSREYE